MYNRFARLLRVILPVMILLAFPHDAPAATPCIPGLPCVVNKTPNDPTKKDDGPSVKGAPNANKIEEPTTNKNLATCDADFMNQIYAKSSLEMNRENIMVQAIMRKPDSVFEYTCFDQFMRIAGTVAGKSFSSSDKWADKGPLGLNNGTGGCLLGNLVESQIQRALAAMPFGEFISMLRQPDALKKIPNQLLKEKLGGLSPQELLKVLQDPQALKNLSKDIVKSVVKTQLAKLPFSDVIAILQDPEKLKALPMDVVRDVVKEGVKQLVPAEFIEFIKDPKKLALIPGDIVKDIVKDQMAQWPVSDVIGFIKDPESLVKLPIEMAKDIVNTQLAILPISELSDLVENPEKLASLPKEVAKSLLQSQVLALAPPEIAMILGNAKAVSNMSTGTITSALTQLPQAQMIDSYKSLSLSMQADIKSQILGLPSTVLAQISPNAAGLSGEELVTGLGRLDNMTQAETEAMMNDLSQAEADELAKRLPPDKLNKLAKKMSPQKQQEFFDRISPAQLDAFLKKQTPKEVTDLLDRMSSERTQNFLNSLDPQNAVTYLDKIKTDKLAAYLEKKTPDEVAEYLDKLSPEKVGEYFDSIPTDRVTEQLDRMIPDQAAQYLEKMTPENAAAFINSQVPKKASEYLARMSPMKRVAALEKLADAKITAIMDELPLEDLADVLEYLNPDKIANYLDRIPTKKIQEIMDKLPTKRITELMNRLAASKIAKYLDYISAEKLAGVLCGLQAQLLAELFKILPIAKINDLIGKIPALGPLINKFGGIVGLINALGSFTGGVPIFGMIGLMPVPFAPIYVNMGPGRLTGDISRLIMKGLGEYINGSFAHKFLGGSIPLNYNTCDTEYTCSFMNQVYLFAKCRNFGADDPFLSFSTLVTLDPRIYPPDIDGNPLKCEIEDPATNASGPPSAGAISPITNDIINVSENRGSNFVSFDNEKPRIDLLEPPGDKCAPPVPTGITVVRSTKTSDTKNNVKTTKVDTYEDKFCPNPSCHYDNEKKSCEK